MIAGNETSSQFFISNLACARRQNVRIAFGDLEDAILLHQASPGQRRIRGKLANGHFIVEDKGDEVVSENTLE